ncbi:type II toxin-antitoxin system VapC family toxin [Rathayibacter sp. YIM 133350]|uniref:type II toxin-antitoxin system VapC family toxin n=1 Tax=Rathayibacter sp. YIM 133350 TaxID=3131992 RepID=UPI00307DA696
MSWLLDTNIVSELRKTNPNPGVASWAESEDPLTMYLSAVVVFELELGVLRQEQKDSRQGAILRSWLDDHVLAEFKDRILPVDLAVAVATSRLHVPDPKPVNDTFIAVTARIHGLTVVTHNAKDFEGTGVRTLDPWS